jgi:outer membrane lipoprotein-sorting protein
MKKKLLVLLAALLPVIGMAQSNSTELIKRMYDRYHNKWHKTFQFTQTTERYRADTLVSKQMWYETIVYPDLLRIDFDKPGSGNGVIYKGDSSFVFRGGKVVRRTKGENELIFFLGGMYAKRFDEVTTHFKALNYDLAKFHTATWKGKPVFVIGAATDDEQVNQLWIDKEKMVAVRFIKYEGGRKQEGVFENHIPLKGAWTETKTSFYVDDKLLQVELYKDCVADVAIDKGFFDVK